MPATIERRFNFTEAAIASLPFSQPGKRLVYYDTAVKNLVLRVSSSTKIYYLLKKVGNQTVFHRIGDANNTSLKNARKRMCELIEQTNRGENPNDEKHRIRDSITVQEFFDEYYFPEHSLIRKQRTSQQADKLVMRLYIPNDVKRAKLLTLKRADIERMHNTIYKLKNSVYSANRGLKLMRQMFNKAIDWGLATNNPAARIKLFPEIQRDRFLQPDEMGVFFDEVSKIPNASARNFILLSLFLGQRRHDIQSLQWSDINFERRVAYIKKTKNGDPQIVPLSTQAIELLKEMETFKTSNWLFPSSQSRSGHLENPQVAWRAMKRRAGLTDLRIHDLRRTFASYQAISGSSNEIIGKALGDKSPAVIPIYARLSEDPVRQSIQRAADKMFAAANLPTTQKDAQ